MLKFRDKQECIPVGCVPAACYSNHNSVVFDVRGVCATIPSRCRSPLMHTSLDAEPLDEDPQWMQTPRVHTPYEQNDTLVKILPCTKLRFLAVKRPPHVLCSVSTFVYNSKQKLL